MEPTDAQRIFAVSLGKMALSHGLRKSLDLQKNLLVTIVLRKAKDAIVMAAVNTNKKKKEAQYILDISLVKKRNRRLDLHKKILVTTVLHKAKSILEGENMKKKPQKMDA